MRLWRYWIGYAVGRWMPLAWLFQKDPAWAALDAEEDDGVIVEIGLTWNRRTAVLRVPRDE